MTKNMRRVEGEEQTPEYLAAVAKEVGDALLSAFAQDPSAALQIRPAESRLRGLIRNLDGSEEWLSYEIDPDQVQALGARAVAGAFVDALRAARNGTGAA